MTFDELINHIKANLGEIIDGVDESSTPKSIHIDKNNLLSCMEFCYESDKLYFDMLSCVTGVDIGPEIGTMEVVYNLYSIPYDHHLMIKVAVDREAPEVPSVYNIWKTADWLEREVFDMYGIKFTDHPDLRRILMPADWEGYPLRKDYQHQETYRGIDVAHEDAKQDQTDNPDRR